MSPPDNPQPASAGAASRPSKKAAGAAKPPIFFGVGAQKAGTTWLYQVLSAYPDCAPLPVKEMHFFDRKYPTADRRGTFVQDDFQQLVKLTRRLAEQVEDAIAAGGPAPYQDGFLSKVKVARGIERIVRQAERAGVHDSASYVRYVEGWRARAPGKLIGEITPAYSILPVEAFREMEQLFPGARYIFIMRDPVGRFWSQLRFWLQGRDRDDDANEMVPKALKRQDFLDRSDYKRTIERLESVVPTDRIHYAFFEDLVSKERTVAELRRLERFLGLSELDEETALGFVEKPANVSRSNPMNEASKALLQKTFAPTYRFVHEKFGQVPASWARVA